MNKVKLKKGDKIIERLQADYEANVANWEARGFTLASDEIKKIKEVKEVAQASEDKTFENETVVQLKPKKRKEKKK